MLNFKESSVQLNYLAGFDTLRSNLDKYIGYFARSERKAPEKLFVSLSDFEKIQIKAIEYVKKNYNQDVDSVAIYYRDFQLIAQGK